MTISLSSRFARIKHFLLHQQSWWLSLAQATQDKVAGEFFSPATFFIFILLALRDQYDFEYGTDKEVDGAVINDKCKALAQKVKEIIDTKSSFADWLNNQNVRNQLKLEIKICLVKNGYPPQYSPEVFKKVMEQVENFEEKN